MDSSPRNKATERSLLPVAGVKRPAPTLLPPFEPLSSSPGLPRLVKKARGSPAPLNFNNNGRAKYPTPVPTSSTGIMSSSPPQRAGARHSLQRVLSTSERAPLGVVPTAMLNENGETLLMGRSSNSSHYQLSANRLISRVHVKARYVPAVEALGPNHIEIMCCGWNGLKLHCQGRTWELSKGDTFTIESENTEIMLDVQDARVRIQWPKRERSDMLGGLSDSSWDDSPRAKTMSRSGRGIPGTPGAPGASPLQSSPLRGTRIASPESPTPAGIPASGASLQALLAQHMGSDAEDDDDTGPAIQIYEDGDVDEQELPGQGPNAADASFATDVLDSFSSELSELHSDDEEHCQPDEENDPIIHSFGPFGANLSNRLASITTRSPQLERPSMRRIPSEDDGSITSVGSGEAVDGKKKVRRHQAAGMSSSAHLQKKERDLAAAAGRSDEDDAGRGRSADGVGLGITVATGRASSPAPPVISDSVDIDTVRNHLVNQLAFSRLSSSPLSTIMSNLPAEERSDLTQDGLRYIIKGTKCIGVIPRHGKDAAGRALESEYYYIADFDEDLSRKAVVDGLRKPSLRNCRKQHKQYYWKRPRTP